MEIMNAMTPFNLSNGNTPNHLVQSRFVMPSNMSNVVPDTPYLQSTSYPTSLPFRGSSALMYHEVERLKTFAGWPLPYMNPRDMSKAGFYYTKRQDIVRCPFCDVEVMNWEEGDDPFDDHRKWNSSCPFINQQPCGNIPMPSDAPPIDLSSLVSPSIGYDTCGTTEIRGLDCINLPKAGETANSNTICKWRPPSFPQFASREERMESFSSWPVSLKIKPNILSEAGFYYTGKGDQTICFYCGGGLKDWEDSDDPWREHAKWFSSCTYVLLNKGQKFVDEALASILPRDKVDESSKNVDSNEKSSKSELDCEGSSKLSEEIGKLGKQSTSEEQASNERVACKVCYGRDLEVMFLPCGHVIACIECSMKLRTCGTCREPIKHVIRAFLS